MNRASLRTEILRLRCARVADVGSDHPSPAFILKPELGEASRVSPEIPPVEWEMAMDWNRVEGNWKQLKGKVKEQWGKLTDDDLDVIAGRRDQLEGKIQERYGYAKDQARKDVDSWFKTLN